MQTQSLVEQRHLKSIQLKLAQLKSDGDWKEN